MIKKLPPIPFKALITTGGRQVETTVVRLSNYGYHTTGCGVISDPKAIEPISISTWRPSSDPLADYDLIKQTLPFAMSDKPVFDAAQLAARKPKTQRDFWKDRRDRTRA
jgi:hypothetical protein